MPMMTRQIRKARRLQEDPQERKRLVRSLRSALSSKVSCAKPS